MSAPILAIDTSTSAITVSVGLRAGALAAASAIDPRAHTELASTLVQRVLAEAALTPADLGAVVVGNGPGPFTGLRVGIVTGLTMAHALGVPAYGVCSLDALALQGSSHIAGELLVATDARRKEVYWARYAVTPGTMPRRLDGPAVARPAELSEQVRALPCVGRGPVLYPELFATPQSVLDVDATAIAAVALAQLEQGANLPVEPLYLRRPDALTSAERQAAGPRL